jgi:hypothetical protein
MPFLLEHSNEINVAVQKAEREWLSSLGLPPQDETGDQGGRHKTESFSVTAMSQVHSVLGHSYILNRMR